MDMGVTVCYRIYDITKKRIEFSAYYSYKVSERYRRDCINGWAMIIYPLRILEISPLLSA